MTKRKPTSDAFEIIYRRFVENDPVVLQALNEERAKHRIATAIIDLRQKLGLSRKSLAQLAGTSTAVIAQLEAADYDDHAASMLERIAAAVQDRAVLSLQFVVTSTTNGAIPTMAKKAKKLKAAVIS